MFDMKNLSILITILAIAATIAAIISIGEAPTFVTATGFLLAATGYFAVLYLRLEKRTGK